MPTIPRLHHSIILTHVVTFYHYSFVLSRLALLNFAEPSSLDPLSPSRNTTTTSQSAWVIITITVTVTSVSIFALLSVVCGFILIKLCQSKSSVSLESFPDPHGHLPDAQVIPVYETVFPMEFQEENVELKDNIAYGTIRQLPAAII